MNMWCQIKELYISYQLNYAVVIHADAKKQVVTNNFKYF